MASTNVMYSISEKQLENMAKQTNSYSGADAIYTQLVDLQVQRKDYGAAFKTAAKISSYINTDKALFSILRQSPQIGTKETAAGKMNYWSNQDTAYREVVAAKIAEKDFEGALKTASKINSYGEKDTALLSIVHSSDLNTAKSALAEISGWNHHDAAVEILANRLIETKDYAGAMSLLSLARFISSIEKLFEKIFGKMEEKGLDKGDLKIIEDAADKLSFNKQKEVFQKLADKYTSLGEPQEAARMQDKIKVVEERVKKVEELLNRIHKVNGSILPALLVGALVGGYSAIASGGGVAAALAITAGAACMAGGLSVISALRKKLNMPLFPGGMFF